MRLSVIRTGFGDAGKTMLAGGSIVDKSLSNLNLLVGNYNALARNHLILVQTLMPNGLFKEFTTDVSWKLGSCISQGKEGHFSPEYVDKVINFLDNLAHNPYPEFVTTDSELWAELEIATTYVRMTELGCWDMGLPNCAKFLNAFADYMFTMNVIYNQPDTIVPIKDCGSASLDTSQLSAL